MVREVSTHPAGNFLVVSLACNTWHIPGMCHVLLDIVLDKEQYQTERLIRMVLSLGASIFLSVK